MTDEQRERKREREREDLQRLGLNPRKAVGYCGGNTRLVYHHVTKRVPVVAGWRGHPCAGGGSCLHKSAISGGVQLAVDWKM